MLRNLLFLIGLFSVITLIFSCKPSYELDSFEILRPDWDMITIRAEYKKSTTFGKEFSYPNSEKVIVRNSRGHILYEGPATANIKIPDKELQSEERVSVTLIAFFDGAQVSSEKFFLASPKRFSVNHLVKYPNSGLNDLGYDISFDASRIRFGSSADKEVILSGAILPFSVEVGMDGGNSVRFSSDRRRGIVALNRQAGGEEFVKALITELEQKNQVNVNLTVETEFAGKKIVFKPIEKIIQNKSDEDIRRESENLANLWGNYTMRSISPNTGYSLVVEVDHFNVLYDLRDQRYSIPMVIKWQSRPLGIGSYTEMIVAGTLNISESGENPEFDLSWKNDAVVRTKQYNSYLNSATRMAGSFLRNILK